VVVFIAPGHGGFSVVASRKVGGAVERNRAKRILRAAWREIPSDASDASDVVLVAREGVRGMKTQDLVSELRELLAGVRG
jgi:ribonuclease P protein component